MAADINHIFLIDTSSSCYLFAKERIRLSANIPWWVFLNYTSILCIKITMFIGTVTIAVSITVSIPIAILIGILIYSIKD